LMLSDELLQRESVGIRSVGLELRRLDGVNLRHLLARDFLGERADTSTHHGCFQWPAGFGRQSLPGSKGLPGDAVQLAFALLDDNQDGIRHRTSVLGSGHRASGSAHFTDTM